MKSDVRGFNVGLRIAIVLFFLLSLALVWSILTASKGSSIPLEFTRVALIRMALVNYGNRHNSHFPDGKTSTEVFQQLINDGDAVPDLFFFDMKEKVISAKNEIDPKNVCFDVTKGISLSSPDWVPWVLPTGYLINYQTGDIVKRSSFAFDGEQVKIAYSQRTQIFPLTVTRFLVFKKNVMPNIMPGKPPNADFLQYHQLTPDGSL